MGVSWCGETMRPLQAVRSGEYKCLATLTINGETMHCDKPEAHIRSHVLSETAHSCQGKNVMWRVTPDIDVIIQAG